MSHRRRSHSPSGGSISSSSKSSINSGGLNSSSADVSSLADSRGHLPASTLSASVTSADTSGPAILGQGSGAAAADAAGAVAKHGDQGQAGIHSPISDPVSVPRDALDPDPSKITGLKSESNSRPETPPPALRPTSQDLNSDSNGTKSLSTPINLDAAQSEKYLQFNAHSGLHHRNGPSTENAASTPSPRNDLPRPGKLATMPTGRSWVVLAAASGAFAALNGTFAKLTTADRTDTIASFLAEILGVSEAFLNPLFRGIFFLLNLLSNAIMWALFTRALTAHSSTTRVSLINTSANFLLTACLGFAIFAEQLPPLWFGGAALLVVGTVIIGRDRKADEAPEDVHEEDGNGLRRRPEKLNGATDPVNEMVPLLAGDEDECVGADGEGPS